MNNNRFESNNPIVRRELVALEKFVYVGRERAVLQFTRELLWMRCFECQTRLVHRGVVIDAMLNKFEDYFGSSLDLMADDEDEDGLIQLCNEYKIDATSTLKLELLLSIKETPVVLGDQSKKFRPSCTVYDGIPSEDNWYRPGIAGLIGDDHWDERAKLLIKEITLRDSEVVWNSDEGNTDSVKRLADELRATAIEDAKRGAK